MEYFFKKYKVCVILAAYFIMILAFYFFVARPMIFGIKNKNNEIQEKIIDQEIKKEKISDIPLMKEQIDMIEENEQKINVSLNKDSVVSLIERLEKISEETGNKIKIELFEEQLEKTPKKKADNKNEKSLIEKLPSDKYIKMSIKLWGEYGSFLNFLGKLENMEYYSDAVSIKLAKGDSKNSGGNPFLGSSSTSNNISPEDKNKIISTIEVVFYIEDK